VLESAGRCRARAFGTLELSLPRSHNGAYVSYRLQPEERAGAAYALATINYGLAVGKFELDVKDGEIRFGTGLDVTGTSLDPQVFSNLVDGAISMLDAYSPRLTTAEFPPPPSGLA